MRKFKVKFDGCGILAAMTEAELFTYVTSKVGKVMVAGHTHHPRPANLGDFEVHELIPVKLKLNLEIV